MRPALLTLFFLFGCALPDIDVPEAERTAASAYPRLVPFDEVLDRIPAQGRITPATTAALDARASNLRARAQAMRASALTQAERGRIRAAVARLRARLAEG